MSTLQALRSDSRPGWPRFNAQRVTRPVFTLKAMPSPPSPPSPSSSYHRRRVNALVIKLSGCVAIFSMSSWLWGMGRPACATCECMNSNTVWQMYRIGGSRFGVTAAVQQAAPRAQENEGQMVSLTSLSRCIHPCMLRLAITLTETRACEAG